VLADVARPSAQPERDRDRKPRPASAVPEAIIRRACEPLGGQIENLVEPSPNVVERARGLSGLFVGERGEEFLADSRRQVRIVEGESPLLPPRS
jgi:hypothetical protein